MVFIGMRATGGLGTPRHCNEALPGKKNLDEASAEEEKGDTKCRSMAIGPHCPNSPDGEEVTGWARHGQMRCWRSPITCCLNSENSEPGTTPSGISSARPPSSAGSLS